MLPLILISTALAGLPLKETHYDVEVAGPLADVYVEQVFVNDSDTFVEATYVFPLHEDAAVDEMSMVIGEREITGVIEEREAAREAYEEARDAGQAAALTEQERPNVFTQSVANIPPGESITVRLHVVQPLDRADGAYEVTLPLVVGPRFVEGVPDADAISPPVSRDPLEHRVDIDVHLRAGVPLALLDSPTHDLGLDAPSPAARSWYADDVAAVQLRDLRASRDFVLRWTLDTVDPQSAAMQQGRHVLVTFEPPDAPPRDKVVPRELIWVVDQSCSQSGRPMEMAKAAMQAAFDGMDARDSFMVLAFSDRLSGVAEVPIAATPANLARARAFVEGLDASGGTWMQPAVEAALDLPRDPARERYVVFFTDGYLGNEGEILGAVSDRRGDAKVFAFGLGSSVNRYLISEIARAGTGTATFVTLEESPEEAVDRFLETIDKPVLSGIEVDWGDWEVDTVYPQHIPDLFAGQPVLLTALVHGRGTDRVTIRGRVGGGERTFVLDVEEVGREEASAVASTWARQHVGELEREQHWGEIPEVREAILATALEYGLLTRYTSLLAVEDVVRNVDGEFVTVRQPVETPDGVDFDMAVSRRYTPPGDPLLTVDAPEDARSVVAAFPWGETAPMRWDALRERWYHRFLVPRDQPDGVLEIAVFVHHADGRLERMVEEMVVDAAAPELDIEVMVEGDVTHVAVFAEEPLRAIEVLSLDDPGSWRLLPILPGDDALVHHIELEGAHCDIEVVAKDRALNTVIEVASCSR